MKQLNPPHIICDICNDDGKCLNNEKNPKYENDMFGNGDIYDCVNYLEKKNNTQGEFMRGYIKNLVVVILIFIPTYLPTTMEFIY